MRTRDRDTTSDIPCTCARGDVNCSGKTLHEATSAAKRPILTLRAGFGEHAVL